MGMNSENLVIDSCIIAFMVILITVVFAPYIIISVAFLSSASVSFCAGVWVRDLLMKKSEK
jgi:hypothetical protein